MLHVYEEDPLTVYNDSDVRFQDEEGLIKKPCCLDPDTHRETCCGFDKDVFRASRKMHSKLLQGEPFVITDPATGQDKYQWTPMSLKSALDLAFESVGQTDNLKQMKEATLPYHDGNLYTGVSLVRLYVQVNYTGPDLHPEVVKRLNELEALCKEKFGDELEETLFSGQEPDPHFKYPVLLILASFYMSTLEDQAESWPFLAIWKFRIMFLKQRALMQRDPELQQRLKYIACAFTNWMNCDCHFKLDAAEIRALFFLEIGQMLNYYFDGLLAERFINLAMSEMGTKAEFTGRKGFRTKFQKTPMTQLTLEIVQSENPIIQHARGQVCPEPEKWVPPSLLLNDDLRLEKMRLVDNSQKPLDYVDVTQPGLVALLIHKKGFTSEDVLHRQEADALINAILECTSNWSGTLVALFTRCLFEKDDVRAVDRALRQLDVIEKMIATRKMDSDDCFRQYLFFGSYHPSKTEVKLRLAEVLVINNTWKEALKIYEELGAFKEIVACYKRINMKHKAEELIRDRIDNKGNTPELLVLLGDVTGDLSHYGEAWTLSNCTSIDSQKRLGEHYFSVSKYGDALPYFKAATMLAPLDYHAWLRLAWCCYNTNDYDGAFSAYLRAVNMEYDNFQVWNNLANSALKMKKPEYALRAYKLATKCNYDEWRVWNNILLVGTDMKELQDTVHAYHRILDLKKDFLDEEVLERMADTANEGRPRLSKLKQAVELLARILSISSRSPVVQQVYGKLLTGVLYCDRVEMFDSGHGNDWYERGLRHYDKALGKMRQDSDWKSSLVKMRKMIKWIVEYRQRRELGIKVLYFGAANKNATLKGYDKNFKHYAKSLHEHLKDLLKSQPARQDDINEMINTMLAETENAFYS